MSKKIKALDAIFVEIHDHLRQLHDQPLPNDLKVYVQSSAQRVIEAQASLREVALAPMPLRDPGRFRKLARSAKDARGSLSRFGHKNPSPRQARALQKSIGRTVTVAEQVVLACGPHGPGGGPDL